MIRVIGIGSPFGADRLAWLAIDHLAGLSLPDCELVKLDRPGPLLLQQFQGVGEVVLLDALVSEEAPGSASLLTPDELQLAGCNASSHGFGVAQALALAAQLGELPSRLHIIGLHTGADPAEMPELDLESLELTLLPLLRENPQFPRSGSV